MSSRSALVASPPLRRCVACRQQDRKAALVRFAVTATERLRVDGRQQAPGRGAYVCAQAICAERALEKDAARLRRSLRSRASGDAIALRAAFDAAVSQRGVTRDEVRKDQGERS